MQLFEKVILKTQIIAPEGLLYEPRQRLNIAFGIDENFARPMGVAMTSVMLNNSQEKVNFHVFTDGIKEEDLRRLQSVAEQFAAVIKIYYIDASIFEKLRSTMQWSIATYYRFIMGQTLHGEVERILYLDADIICLGALRDLFEIDFAGKTIAAVNDVIDAYNFPIRMKKINITSGKYFNAGMMCIDIMRWHEKKISEHALQKLADEPERYDYLDQDVLNVLLENDIFFLDRTYNYLYNMERNDAPIPDGVKLLHYATRQKPWHRWCVHPLTEHFANCARQSPWRDVPLLDQPRNYKEMKMMAKAMWQEGQVIQALQWYWRYCCGKRHNNR